MPTKEQQKELRTKLLEEKELLEKRMKENETHVDFGSDVDSFEEESDEAEEFANRVGIQRITEEKIENIEQALSKMEKGSYGACEQCGNPISYEVLSITPESKLCKSCKLK